MRTRFQGGDKAEPIMNKVMLKTAKEYQKYELMSDVGVTLPKIFHKKLLIGYLMQSLLYSDLPYLPAMKAETDVWIGQQW